MTSRRRRLLLIEDSPCSVALVLSILGEELKRRGVSTHVATTLTAASAVFHLADAVICDRFLPDSSTPNNAPAALLALKIPKVVYSGNEQPTANGIPLIVKGEPDEAAKLIDFVRRAFPVPEAAPE